MIRRVMLLLLTACSSSESDPAPPENRPPVIDGVDAPPQVTLAATGNYEVPFKIAFHDDDKDAVTKIRVRVKDSTVDITGSVSNPTPQAVAAQGAFAFQGTAPKATYEMLMSVIDARGAESLPVVHAVTLK